MDWTATGKWLAQNNKDNIYDNYREYLSEADPNALSQLEAGWNSVKNPEAMNVEGGRKRRGKTARRRKVKSSRKRRM